LFMYSIN